MIQDVSSLPSIGDTDDYHIVTVGARTGTLRYTVVVAQASQIQADTISTVAWFMLGATPLLLRDRGGVRMAAGGAFPPPGGADPGQVARINAERLDGRVDVPPTNDEIHALALTMNTMLDRLQASDTEQRRFVSDASHELRSPLATLKAGIEIAAADPTGAMWLQMKDVLAEETARMSFLVEDLLTLAKANDGGLRVEQKDVDLDDVLDQEIRRLRSTSRNQISVGARSDPDPRRRPAAGAGPPERPGQRRPPRPVPDRRGPAHGRGPGHPHCRQRRRPHPGGGPGTDLRTVRPARWQPFPGRRRQRTGPGHRGGNCGRPSREHPSDGRTGGSLPL